MSGNSVCESQPWTMGVSLHDLSHLHQVRVTGRAQATLSPSALRRVPAVQGSPHGYDPRQPFSLFMKISPSLCLSVIMSHVTLYMK